MTGTLDANSGVPLYQQLTQILRDAISDGTLSVNVKIPTESELGEQYGISRITVRNAIDELASEGLVIKRQGKGTYVAPNQIVRKNGEVYSFTRACEEAGRIPTSRVVRLAILTGTPSQTRFLGLPENSNIIHIQRVRLADKIPVMLETNIFPTSFDFLLHEPLEGSLYGVLDRHGIKPTHYKKTINVCYARELEQEFLEVEQSKPLLLVDDHVYDQNYRPLHYCKQVIRSDLFHFRIEG